MMTIRLSPCYIDKPVNGSQYKAGPRNVAPAQPSYVIARSGLTALNRIPQALGKTPQRPALRPTEQRLQLPPHANATAALTAFQEKIQQLRQARERRHHWLIGTGAKRMKAGAAMPVKEWHVPSGLIIKKMENVRRMNPDRPEHYHGVNAQPRKKVVLTITLPDPTTSIDE